MNSTQMETVESSGVVVEVSPRRRRTDGAAWASLTIPTAMFAAASILAYYLYTSRVGPFSWHVFTTLPDKYRAVYLAGAILIPSALGFLIALGGLVTFHHRRVRPWASLILLVSWGGLAWLALQGIRDAMLSITQ